MQITDEPDTIAIQELSQEELRETFRKQLSQLAQDSGSGRLQRPEVLDEYTQKELDFYNAVLAKYDIWSTEVDPIVLWDIDDTIGKNDFSNSPKWRFRPSFRPLVDEIKRRYPNMKNGLLSTRDTPTNILPELIKANIDTSFFESDYLYASRSVVGELPYSQALEYEDALQSFGSPKYGDIQKYCAIKVLEQSGLNIKLIDDFHVVATAMGPNGLSCRQMMAP